MRAVFAALSRLTTLVVLAVVSACATTGTENEVSKLRREVRSLKAELAEARLQLEQLENKVAVLKGPLAPAPANKAPVALAAPKEAAPTGRMKPSLPQLPIVRLDGRQAQNEANREEWEAGATEDGGPPVMIKLGPGAAAADKGEKLPVDHSVLSAPDPVLSGKKAEKADYDLALETLRDRKKPAEARALFAAFQQKYPSSSLAENAKFWSAECSVAEEQHQRAIDELNKFVGDHPASSKVPDALLRIGQSSSKLGKSDQAKDALRRVTRGYPASEAAPEAEKLLRALEAPAGR